MISIVGTRGEGKGHEKGKKELVGKNLTVRDCYDWPL